MSTANDQMIDALLRDAEAAGSLLYTPDRTIYRALRRRAAKKSPEIVEPAPSVFARASLWQALDPCERSRHLIRALAAQHEGWIFCAQSAALMLGFPVSYHTVAQVHVARPRGGRTRSSGIVVRHEVGDDEPVVAGGVKVTSFYRTVFDCLATLEFSEALQVADRALRVKGISRRRLVDELRRRFKGHHGIGRAIDVCAWAEPGAESGGESILRAAIIEQGFALPRLQVTLPDPIEQGRRFRVDLVWRDAEGRPIFGELDGKRKYTDPQMTRGRSLDEILDDEHRRQARLTMYRASFVRLSFWMAKRPQELARTLAAYGVPFVGAPEVRDGVPVPSKEIRERPTYVSCGTLIINNLRVRYTQIAA